MRFLVFYCFVFSLLLFSACGMSRAKGSASANEKDSSVVSQDGVGGEDADSLEEDWVAVFDEESDSSRKDSEDSEDDDSDASDEAAPPHVCVSEDGRVTIESARCSGGGTSPDYWAKWTIVGDDGKKHVVKMPTSSYQSQVHAVRKADGKTYYIVNCFGKASGADGYEWLEAYEIVGKRVREVKVVDGGRKRRGTEEPEFSVNYKIPNWFFKTRGFGYDWILEYDARLREIYVPITVDDREMIDRYRVWRHNGTRFVCMGERGNRNLHPSLWDYVALTLYASSKDYVVRVDSLRNKELRLAVWRKPKKMSDVPDVVVSKGKRKHHGLDSRGYTLSDDYHFIQEGTKYVINFQENHFNKNGACTHHEYFLKRRGGKTLVKQEFEYREK